MKAFKIFVIGMMLLFIGAAKAQVSVNVNIGSPPMWGPAGYTEVHYYYLPDVEAYYDVHSSMFIYYGGGAWIHRAHLPSNYSSYDLYGGYKVVMNDYRGNAPYTLFHTHKIKYKKGYRGRAQKTIGHKPGRGNSNGPSNNNKSNGKKVERNNDRSPAKGSHSNDQNMKKDHGNGNGKSHGNGKKK